MSDPRIPANACQVANWFDDEAVVTNNTAVPASTTVAAAKPAEVATTDSHVVAAPKITNSSGAPVIYSSQNGCLGSEPRMQRFGGHGMVIPITTELCR